MFRNNRILILFISVVFCTSFKSCKKNNQTDPDDSIPYQAVNLTIYPNDPLYFKVRTVGGWMYIDGGVNGIVLYRKTVTNSSSDFVAVERTSTYYPGDPYARVKVESDNLTLKDSISGSKWQIYDGVLISGPATQNLKLYTTVFDGINTLTIKN
jgi:hypothetical protein